MRSVPAAIAFAAILTIGLAGCVPQGEPAPSRTPGPSTTAPATETATPVPTAPAASATPVTIDCNTLVDPQTVYDFNPNYGNQPAFTPAAGSAAAAAVASQGVACNWVNQTSGETFVVAVARPAAAELAAIRSAAEASGTAVSGVGDAAYFSSAGGTGEVEAFTGPYWVVATSDAFYEAADARPLLDAAVAALR